MNTQTVVPNVIRRRYSAKITASLAGVVVLTVVVGTVFLEYVYHTAENGQVSIDTAIAAIVGLLLVFILHLGIVGIVLGGNVSLALRQLADRSERIGAGDFDVDLETDRVDEVGTLYGSFGAMRDSLEVTLEDLETQRKRALEAQRETERRNEALSAEAERFSREMAACAAGDLHRRLDPQTDDEAMRAIARSFNEMVDDLGTTVGWVQRFASTVDEASSEVQVGAREIRRGSEDVSIALQEISDGSHRQTEDLEVAAREVRELSATVEEMTSTASTIAEQSRRVADLAEDGRREAVNATNTMDDAERLIEDVAATVRQLNVNTEQIESVIELIDDIAEQTNMLALNASLESARSHDAVDSKKDGFDVVAEEVKELARQTQDAVDEIEGTLQSIKVDAETSAEGIDAVEDRIGTAAATVEDLRSQLEAIATDIDHVDDGIQTINQATISQAESTEELATIVDEVASVSAETTAQAEDVAAASEEATATSETVYNEAADLDQRADRLAAAVGVFDVPEPDAPSESGGPAGMPEPNDPAAMGPGDER